MNRQDTAIILLHTQLGENIGAAARVMKNFGFSDLRIVAPKCEWPNEKALAMSAGAKDLIESAKIFDNISDAAADMQYLFATTIRDRDLLKPAINSQELLDNYPIDLKVGIMFGGERCGLTNEDVALADKILSIATKAECSSMNLAQSVAVICYELQRLKSSKTQFKIAENPASKNDLFGMMGHLESELDKAEYWREPKKREAMLNNINNMFSKTGWNDQEVRTFRGVINSLIRRQ